MLFFLYISDMLEIIASLRNNSKRKTHMGTEAAASVPVCVRTYGLYSV